MRQIKHIHKGEYRPIADLITYSPMPTARLQQVDPFIFLNHHGPQVYPKNNNGLPFGPHPHRGMETVTFILEGDIMHKDSGGHESVIEAGGIQYMTAGKGLIHAEVSSDNFKKEGGNMEILQLWLNLPAKHKMTEPKYVGLQKNEIPVVKLDDGRIEAQVVLGEFAGTKAALQSFTDINFATLYLEEGANWEMEIPAEQNIFFYVVRGALEVNGTAVSKIHLVEFANEGSQLRVHAKEKSVILFGHATPFKEPMVAQGPFVMNTQQEIIEAYQDYQQGKFGVWNG